MPTPLKITYAHQKLAQHGSTLIMDGTMLERGSLSAVIRAIAAKICLAKKEKVTVMMMLNVQVHISVVLTTVEMVQEVWTVAPLHATMIQIV